MMKESTLRTTITLPKSLLEATDQRVKEGKAKNRNDFITLAVKKQLEQLKREEIDTALAEMAQDLNIKPKYYRWKGNLPQRVGKLGR